MEETDQSSEPSVGDTQLNYFVDGKCNVCESDKKQETVSCLLCEKQFHMINCAENENADCLPTSAFNHIHKAINKTGKYATRPGNFRFICNTCTTKVEKIKTCTTNDNIQILDSKVNTLANDISVIKKLLSKTTEGNSTSHEPTASQQAANQATHGGNVWTNNEQVNKMKSHLVISKDAKCDLNDPAISINSCSAQIHNKYPDKNGNTVIVCGSPKSRDALKQHILDKGVNPDKLMEPKPRYPTISVVGLPTEMEIEELRSKLLFKNPQLDQVCTNEHAVFDIVSVKSLRKNTSVFQAFVRVSDDVRAVIKSNGDKLFLGWQALPVYDHLYIKRCNKCQGYNHYHRDCKNTQCCGLCASSNHQYINCPHKDKAATDKASFFSCINCKNANKPDTAHPAYSSMCSMYRYEQTLLKKSLASESKNY